jgi:hypothetical protein
MSAYGTYEECRTDCLCHDCKNRRSFHSPRGCVADCQNCDGIPVEKIPPHELEDPWDYKVGYKSKRIGCELFEKEK